MLLLAQVEETAKSMTPDFWANWGIASLILFLVGGLVVWGFREWWAMYKPHYARRLEAQVEKYKKEGDFIDHVKKTYDQSLEAQNRSATALEQLVQGQSAHNRTHRAMQCLAEAGRHVVQSPDAQKAIDRAIDILADN